MSAGATWSSSGRWSGSSRSSPRRRRYPGATYGSFGAACHYADGWLTASEQSGCEASHPTTAAPFAFRHPKLITLHVLLVVPNPAGIDHPTNPQFRPYNQPQ